MAVMPLSCISISQQKNAPERFAASDNCINRDTKNVGVFFSAFFCLEYGCFSRGPVLEIARCLRIAQLRANLKLRQARLLTKRPKVLRYCCRQFIARTFPIYFFLFLASRAPPLRLFPQSNSHQAADSAIADLDEILSPSIRDSAFARSFTERASAPFDQLN